MSLSVGLLAEDPTDVDVVREVARRLAESRIQIKSWVGRGCGRFKGKGARIVGDLVRRGATHIVVLHDLDRDPDNNELRDEATLRRELSALVREAPLHLICIPVEELEAWFWSCETTLAQVARKPHPAHPSPHMVVKPKEALMALSKGANRKPRYSTNDNKELAQQLDFDLCAQRCTSFRELRDLLIAAATT